MSRLELGEWRMDMGKKNKKMKKNKSKSKMTAGTEIMSPAKKKKSYEKTDWSPNRMNGKLS